MVYYTYNEEGGVFEIRRTEYVDDTPLGDCGFEKVIDRELKERNDERKNMGYMV